MYFVFISYIVRYSYAIYIFISAIARNYTERDWLYSR